MLAVIRLRGSLGITAEAVSARRGPNTFLNFRRWTTIHRK
jgi:hypothetical protein